MTYTHTFETFKMLFRSMIDGEYDIDDIHELYVYYKENPRFEDAKEFLLNFFFDCNEYKNQMYLKHEYREI